MSLRDQSQKEKQQHSAAAADLLEAREKTEAGQSALTVPSLKKLYEPSGDQIRPWVRYWARGLDSAFFGMALSLLLGFFYEDALEMSDQLFTLISLCLYVFFEAALLAIFGTTPGKTLLKIRLRNNDDTKLSYGEALGRALSVWFRGVGLGIPLVNLFTHLSSYSRLSNYGATLWDANGGFTVSHRKIGAWRIILTLLIFVWFIYLTVGWRV